MKLKIFENKEIPKEVHRFYDDLATVYLKSSYENGRLEEGEIKKIDIGRYRLNEMEISLVEENINISFLIHSEEGYKKQDEIILKYDKEILSKQLEEFFFQYAYEIFDISGIKYFDGKSYIEGNTDKKSIVVTKSGLVLAAHVFGIIPLKKFFEKEYIKIKDNLAISDLIDSKEYDLSFIIPEEKKVIPKLDEKEKEDIKVDDEFIGQEVSKPLIEQVKELFSKYEFLKKKYDELIKSKDVKNNKKEEKVDNEKLLSSIKEILKNNKNEEENTIRSDISKDSPRTKKKLKEKFNNEYFEDKNDTKIDNEKLLSSIKEILKNNKNEEENIRKSYISKDSPRTRKKLKEKFDDEYRGKDYVEYFEDTTNSKVDDDNRKAFNKILESANTEDESIVNQKNFDNYRTMYSNSKFSPIDFLYDRCIYSLNPLKTLEKFLCFLTCKYENENSISSMTNAIMNVFEDGLKNIFIKKLNKTVGTNFPENNANYLSELGFADVDDIKFKFKKMSLEEYFKTKEYKFLQIFVDRNLIKESYTGKYKRARRLLDNLLIEMIKNMTKLKDSKLDKYEDDRTNILRNTLLFIDEFCSGLDKENYLFITKTKRPFNITNFFINLLKSKEEYRDVSIRKISDLMSNRKYEEYTNYRDDKKRLIKIFPKYSSLEYNMRIRSSYNISKFYSSFYNKKLEKEKNYLVCDGAKLRCTNSSDISYLKVLSSTKYIDGKAVANVESKNIVPFKFCSVNKKCVPVLSNWKTHTETKVGNKKVLLDTSRCFCKFGGVLSIDDPNQKKSNIKDTELENENLKFEIDDYVNIERIYKYLKDNFFTRFARYYYSTELNIHRISKNTTDNLIRLLKPKIDEKNLILTNEIVAVDNEINAIVSVKELVEIIKGYFYGKIGSNRFKNKWIDIGKQNSNTNDFYEFINNVKKHLKVVYSPYNIKTHKIKREYWMDKVFSEYNKNYTEEELKRVVSKYHREGGGINAGIRTPWCASFVNYILDTGFKSASSQCFYSEEGKKYFEKIDEAKYGAILVLSNNDGTGHCSFVLSENNKGYFCLGGNQSKRIKKSFYKKNNKVKGLYWPK